MAIPTLDRLSALLQGLAPRVSLNDKPNGFGLHILVDESPQGLGPSLAKMALLICPALGAGAVVLPLLKKKWMSFEVGLDGPLAPIFLSEFVEPLLINLDKADASLIQIIHLISSEMAVTRCGQPLLMNRAGDILLIGLLRHLVAQPQKTTGLFSALANPRIAKTLVAIHEDASKGWSLETLSLEAGMSRTSYAHQFKQLMQITPGKYIGTIRLNLARRLIVDGVGLKQAARSTGYSSASTLSRAMSRLSTKEQRLY